MKIVSQNIMATPAMKFRRVMHDLMMIKTLGDVFGLQEMKWPWYWVALRKVFPKARYGKFPGNITASGSAQVIVWDKSKFALIKSGRRLLIRNNSLTKARFATWVLLEERSTGKRFYFVNTHFTPSPSKYPSMWKQCRVNYQHLIGQLKGYPIIGVGDMNSTVLAMTPAQSRRHTPAGSIDLIWSVGKVKESWVHTNNKKMYTDHETRIAELELY